jgi:hypothetical protein
MKRYYIYFLLFLIFGSLITCTSKKKDKFDFKAEQQKVEKKAQEIKSKLIANHNAIIFPPKEFESKKIFTIYLQKFFQNNIGKSLLLEGSIDDITENNNIYWVQFSSFLSDNLLEKSRIILYLQANLEEINSILKLERSNTSLDNQAVKQLFRSLLKSNDYFIVCQIMDVKKLISYSLRDNPSDGEEAEIKFEFPDVFSARGKPSVPM